MPKGTHTIDQALYLFGRPASVTAFLRSNRGVDSEVDDTYTVMLQYEGEQKNLLVTIKTAIVSHMKDQMRFFVRGTAGTYLKVKLPVPHFPLPGPLISLSIRPPPALFKI
jgi:predicted dehydrogenase